MNRLRKTCKRAVLRLEYSVWMTEAYLADLHNDVLRRASCELAAHEVSLMLRWLS
jgi:hypothetical protein